MNSGDQMTLDSRIKEQNALAEFRRLPKENDIRVTRERQSARPAPCRGEIREISKMVSHLIGNYCES
jgi:hypothetical protein